MNYCLYLLCFTQTWSVALGGDIMLNGVGVNKNPFAGIASVFKECDLVIANLEVPLTNGLARTPRKSAAEIAAKTQYALKANPKHGNHLKEAGFHYLALGNNHTMDYTERGMNETMFVLKSMGILYGGAGKNIDDATQARFFYVKGTKIGVLSFLAFHSTSGRNKCMPATEASAGVVVLDFPGAVGKAQVKVLEEFVKKAKQECVFLIVYLHWGVERQTIPNAYQVTLGRAWIDAGADLVLGSHPHVLQGAEIYNGKPIVYSLGDLMHSRNKETAVLKLNYSGEDFNNIEFVPCVIKNQELIPENLNQARANLEQYKKLCQGIKNKYPNKSSYLPNIRLYSRIK